MMAITQIRSGVSLKWELCNDRGYIIFCHVDCFCLQEKRKMKREVFFVPYTEGGFPVMAEITHILAATIGKNPLQNRISQCQGVCLQEEHDSKYFCKGSADFKRERKSRFS